MRKALQRHWPEYLMEAGLLGIFMVSAAMFSTLVLHPASPLAGVIRQGLPQRELIGAFMGLTAIALSYSAWGKQSGAHYNPAVTFTFWRMGKMETWDATFYVAAQFVGGLVGVVLSAAVLRDYFRQPPVTYAATLPGELGPWPAFVAEVVISFVLMSTVLAISNHATLARYTPLFAGCLVALFITFESPISGMSMNPARSFASAAPAGLWSHLWIYLMAPLCGMLLAAELRRLRHKHTQACPKLYHDNEKRCIFCGSGMARVALLLVIVAIKLPAQIHDAAVGPISLTVADLDRSVDFYKHVLSFEREEELDGHFDSFDRLTGIFGTNVRVAHLRLGEERVELVQYISPEGHPYPADSRSNDDWFQHIAIVVRDMNAAYLKLRSHSVHQISTEPQRLPGWNLAAAGIKAHYFRDPDGHPLELIFFPPGKGDPRWQASGQELFLGIDHTAIAVENSDRSIAFYRDVLGFHVTGESLNYGTEQEHLNHVFGSRVHITSLRAAAGPGVEFLEYLAPRNGRAFPSESRANDLWHVHTTIMVTDLSSTAKELRAHRIEAASDPEPLPPLAAPASKGFFVQDPDGHSVLVRTR